VDAGGAEVKFSGSEQAIRFAYNISNRSIVQSPKLEPGISGSKQGLTPHDLHAQAAIIMARLKRLNDPQQAAVRAMHAPWGVEKQVSLDYLTEYLWPTNQGRFASRHDFALSLIFACKKDEETSLRKLAKRLTISYRMARGYREAAAKAHADLYIAAVYALDSLLFDLIDKETE
jgi:hypothetical protein